MALRKIHATKVGSCAVNIYRDAEWGEFVVKTVVGGKTVGGKGGGYHTDSKSDARGTAAFEVRRLRKLAKCRR